MNGIMDRCQASKREMLQWLGNLTGVLVSSLGPWTFDVRNDPKSCSGQWLVSEKNMWCFLIEIWSGCMQFSTNTTLCHGEYWKYALRSSFTQPTNSTGQQANEVCAYCSMTYPILTDKGNDTYQLILEKKCLITILRT